MCVQCVTLPMVAFPLWCECIHMYNYVSTLYVIDVEWNIIIYTATAA